VFSHLPEYVGEGGARVTTTLPVTAEPEFRPAGAVPPFFAGLLPEGRRLSALRAAMKTSGDDELSLLLAVGGDTVGDIQILPEGADLFVEDVAGAVDRVGGGTAQRSPDGRRRDRQGPRRRSRAGRALRSAPGRHHARRRGRLSGARTVPGRHVLTTEAVCTALATATDAPIVGGRVLLRWVAVAHVTCNGDLHAKTLAVGERPDGSYRGDAGLRPAVELSVR
jgi:HipA-like protein